MKIDLFPITNEHKQNFFDSFFMEYNKLPFGVFGKRDIECLLLKSLFESKIIEYNSNREVANLLGINEQKLKSYILDIRYKYLEDKKNENIQLIIKEIFIRDSNKMIYDNNWFIFCIEDPVRRMDFEQGLKEVGYFIDSSFNKEIVKVRDYALIAFLFRNKQGDDTYDTFAELIQTTDGENRELLDVLSAHKSWLERGKDIISKVGQGYEAISLLRKIALLATTGTFI